MFNYNSSPTVIYCTFYKNSTGNGQDGVYPAGLGSNGGDGAGMYNYNSNPTVSYCTFEENSTGIGGTGGPGKDAGPAEMRLNLTAMGVRAVTVGTAVMEPGYATITTAVRLLMTVRSRIIRPDTAGSAGSVGRPIKIP